MSNMEISVATQDRIKALAADIFEVDAASIDLSMGPEDIDRWDSLNHMRLITEFEASFQLRLAMQQIQDITTLGDLASFAAESAA